MYVVACMRWVDQRYQSRFITEKRDCLKSGYVIIKLSINTAVSTRVRIGFLASTQYYYSKKPTYSTLGLHTTLILFKYKLYRDYEA